MLRCRRVKGLALAVGLDQILSDVVAHVLEHVAHMTDDGIVAQDGVLALHEVIYRDADYRPQQQECVPHRRPEESRETNRDDQRE